MMPAFGALVCLLIVIGYGVLYRRVRKGRVGTASIGTAYDLLNEDRRKAVEIIVEQKAEVADPETSDDTKR